MIYKWEGGEGSLSIGRIKGERGNDGDGGNGFGCGGDELIGGLDDARGVHQVAEAPSPTKNNTTFP